MRTLPARALLWVLLLFALAGVVRAQGRERYGYGSGRQLRTAQPDAEPDADADEIAGELSGAGSGSGSDGAAADADAGTAVEPVPDTSERTTPPQRHRRDPGRRPPAPSTSARPRTTPPSAIVINGNGSPTAAATTAVDIIRWSSQSATPSATLVSAATRFVKKKTRCSTPGRTSTPARAPSAGPRRTGCKPRSPPRTVTTTKITKHTSRRRG